MGPGACPSRSRPCPWGASQCRQRKVGHPDALTWPGQAALGACAVVIDVPVDNLPGRSEQVDQFWWEEFRAGCGGSIHICRFSHALRSWQALM